MYLVKSIYKPVLFLIDLLGYVFVHPFIRKDYKKSKIKKILVIRVDHIGDFVMTLPVFENLRKNFPNAKIHVLCRRLTKELAEHVSSIDKIYVFDPDWFLRKEGHDSLDHVVNELKKEHYDLVIEPHADPRNIRLAKKVGKFVLAYPIRGFGFMLFKHLKYPNKHMIENNLFLLESIGMKIHNKTPHIRIPKNVETAMKKFLHDRPICINPGTGRKEKEWKLNNWIQLVDELSKNHTVILTGAKNEIDANAIIAKKTGVANLTGKLSLIELAALLKYCRLFIGPDTGPMHIAHAVGTSVVALFGPTDPYIWGYTEKPHVAIKKDNMDDISVSDVISKINKIKY